MDKQIVVRLQSSFEDMVRRFPNTDTEFWYARDLQMLLGYTRWENFAAGPPGHELFAAASVRAGFGYGL